MRVVLLFSGKLNEWFNANVLQGVCEVLEPEGYDVVAHICHRQTGDGALLRTIA